MIIRKKTSGYKAHFNLTGMYLIGLAFCLLAAVLLAVQANIQYTVRKEAVSLLPREELIRRKGIAAAEKTADCLLVWEEDDGTSAIARDAMSEMLREMKVPFDLCLAGGLTEEALARYGTVLLAITHYQLMPDLLLPLQHWVRAGGHLMIVYPPFLNGSFMTLSGLLGIKENAEPARVETLRFREDFLLGGAAHDYPLDDPYDAAMGFALTEDCEVFMSTTDPYPVPLIWRRRAGEGTVVVHNFSSLEKATRGIHWAAYTLLGDCTVYPVINGSAFYIDDFPAPVPEGSGIYILRDYGLSIADFYTQVWWNDVYNLSHDWKLRYTGLVIENYSDQVEGEFQRNRDTSRFLYYGNMLLRAGGEIGIHGYNHMPLVPETFLYGAAYQSYRQWPSVRDMTRAIQEVMGFTASLFPDEDLQVYVPPSNILSPEGVRVLVSQGLRAIAAVYLGGDLGYEQEFAITPADGIVNTPRIISGYAITPYMQLAALSELNYHLVNSHFQHPDDILDEDRGAALGWETLRTNFRSYLEWLYAAAPEIRNLTGSEMAGAVMRYDLLDYTAAQTADGLDIRLTGRVDEAWMMLRLNEGQRLTGTEGATFSRLSDSLYLLRCTADHVRVKLEKAK